MADKVQRIGKGTVRANHKMARITRTVMDDPSDLGDGRFAVITKLFGKRMMIVLADRKEHRDGTVEFVKREAQAKITGQLLSKAKCWTVGAVIVVAPGAQKDEWEVQCLMERKDIKRLLKENAIPQWLATVSDGATAAEAVQEIQEDVGFEFEELPDEEEEEAEGGKAAGGAGGAGGKKVGVPKKGTKEFVLMMKAKETAELTEADIDNI